MRQFASGGSRSISTATTRSSVLGRNMVGNPQNWETYPSVYSATGSRFCEPAQRKAASRNALVEYFFRTQQSAHLGSHNADQSTPSTGCGRRFLAGGCAHELRWIRAPRIDARYGRIDLHHLGKRQRACRLQEGDRRVREREPGRQDHAQCGALPADLSHGGCPAAVQHGPRYFPCGLPQLRKVRGKQAVARSGTAARRIRRRIVHRCSVAGRTVRRKALRRAPSHRHHGHSVQQGGLRRGGDHLRADHRRNSLDLGRVRKGGADPPAKTSGREVPVRLQLAGPGSGSLAQLAVPGGWPLPRQKTSLPGHRFRGWPGRNRLHKKLLHEKTRAGQQLGQVVNLCQRPVLLRDSGDDLCRRIPDPGCGEARELRVGSDLLPARQARWRRSRRKRSGRNGRYHKENPGCEVSGLHG